MDTQRIALVTGANKGIGFEIARQLASAGVRVVLGARNLGFGEAAAQKILEGTATATHLDLDDHASIARTAAEIEAGYGRLDILVNNAGIFDFADAPPSSASLEAVRRTMEVNFFGTLAVTQAMLPLLRKAPAGRIVNLSSSLGSLTLNGSPDSTYYGAQFIGYNASKAALNMMTVQLREELRDTNIVVNSISPGFVGTDLNGGTGPLTPEEGARLPVRFALEGEENGGFFEAEGRTPW
ncbi:MAG: short-chain dehydrogenase [Martelella sp.]|uniref:SDR family oxidoreductase n=1 Tax=unclassified Martelella TaxID=2629616 RepID=UPI000C53F1F4|nr:SDR family oxidoreductase [Martelella sp.]MAU19578.1 short-chain dehydrogenase [Martelella sp.]|tara:strand:- start:630 stop:1346 length:717 start_codon:yes stop_codon:yes gene_type:complete